MRYLWLLAFGLSLPALASVEQQLAQCAVIDDKLDRLICYDQLAGQHHPAPEAKGVATTAPVAASVANEMSEPTAPVSIQPVAEAQQFGKVKKSEEEPTRIELEVASVEMDQHDKLQLTFTNGQVWKQTESRRYRLKAGDKVFIKKGALNAFYLGSDKQNATIRVKRLN